MKKVVILMLMMFSVLLAKDIDEYKSIKVLESTIENRITKELKLYTNKSFNINVNIFVIQIEVLKKEFQKEKVTMHLPGIHIYNEQEKPLLDKDISTQQIDHIEVLITLDKRESKFVQKMAKKIAKDKADISQVRGDKITIKKISMTKDNDVNELAEIVKSQLLDFEDTIKEIERKKDKELSDTREFLTKELIATKEILNKEINNLKEISSNNNEKLQKSINQQLEDSSNEQRYSMEQLSSEMDDSTSRLYYWIGFITLALLVVVYLGFLYASQRSKHIKEDIRFIEDDMQKEIEHIENKLDKKYKNLKSNTNDTATEQSMINDLVTLVIARKDGVKEFIVESLRSEKGREKVALLVQHIGVRSVEALFYNTKETLIEVLECADSFQFEKENLSDKIDVLYRELSQYTNTMYQDTAKYDSLEFLNKLTIDQLLLLLEGEDIVIKAFIISQIDKEKSPELFDRLPEEIRLYLYMEIANIKPMTEKEYSALAQNLSKKIIKLPQVNNFVVDGKEEMVDRIKLIEPSSQKRMLEILTTQNVELYQSIRERYTFFQDIATFEEAEIKSLIFECDEDTVALSLSQMNEDDKNRILSFINERKMVIIDEKIRFYKENRPSKQMLIKAQYKFTQEAEKLVRSKL